MLYRIRPERVLFMREWALEYHTGSVALIESRETVLRSARGAGPCPTINGTVGGSRWIDASS